jgi:hypothetical protein
MKFLNELHRPFEGELVFPLREGQPVSRFAMDLDDKLRVTFILNRF